MLRLDSDASLDDALGILADLLGAPSVVLAALTSGESGVALEHWRAAHAPAGLRELIDALLGLAIPGTSPLDPRQLGPELRDRAFDLGAWLDRDVPGAWQDSPILADVAAPLGLAQLFAAGALVHDDAGRLLGWFGAILPAPPTTLQLETLDSLVPIVRRRLTVERKLRASSRQRSALQATLERLGTPAFVIGPSGAIHESNTTARALLASRPDDVAAALTEALARREHPLRFELRPIGDGGSYLAVLPPATPEDRIAAATALASAQWSLTARQRDVLEHLAYGRNNAAIGKTLGISERTVELHVTAILDRAGVENRTRLVARVLT